MANHLSIKEKQQTLINVINARKDAFRELLPKYLTPERLFRIAQIVITKNPTLANCTPASFLVAMMDAARSGMEPNGKDAALVMYGTDCQFQPMFQGMIRQAVNSGAVKRIFARVVYANDRFMLKYNPEPIIDHEPAQDDEGDIVGAYAYAIMPDDSVMIEYMNRRQLDHIRGKSKAGAKGVSPWQTDPEEMYRKTPVKRLFKYLSIPETLEYAVQVDNMAETGKDRADIPLIEMFPEADSGVTKTEKLKLELKKPGRIQKPTSPEARDEAIDTQVDTWEGLSPENPAEAASSSGAPDMADLLAVLAGKGWPEAKLEIRFGKKRAEWGEVELKKIADLAVE